MDKSAEKRLKKIYQLSDDVTETRARNLFITYNERKGGLTAERRRRHRIEDLQVHMDKLILARHDEILRHYSNAKLIRKPLSSPSPTPSPVPLSGPSPLARPSRSPLPAPSPRPVLTPVPSPSPSRKYKRNAEFVRCHRTQNHFVSALLFFSIPFLS